jgi:hypothetical protein
MEVWILTKSLRTFQLKVVHVYGVQACGFLLLVPGTKVATEKRLHEDLTTREN